MQTFKLIVKLSMKIQMCEPAMLNTLYTKTKSKLINVAISNKTPRKKYKIYLEALYEKNILDPKQNNIL